MEVLECHIIMSVPWWTVVTLIIAVSCILFAIIALFDDEKAFGSVLIGIFIVSAIVFVICPKETPTDKWSTTVEITDLESYKELVQREYTFKKVYDDREIYIVEGDEVEAAKG